ncbi:MAG: prephenate dehydrogenase/arogenate dehydrogenase family protein [Fibrobacteria bacterium]|nr:prephenate dehydrogenase/arogenate dehydrogenase family protein [Fibrobacteria bacterium]
MLQPDPPHFSNICIAGLGLLGSSLAAALKSRYPSIQITGVSSPVTLKKAETLKIIDKAESYDNIDSAVIQSDLTLLCTPITHITGLLDKWSRNLPSFTKECIITDVGSTKSEICSRARKAFSNQQQYKAHFVGSHPMTGSEKHGIDACDPHLFENAAWVICPEKDCPPSIISSLETFISGLGSMVSVLSPGIHDEVVAHVSHLPQLLSTALAGFISRQTHVVENSLQIAGGGFRDMTRLASSSLNVWEPIFSTNHQEISKVLSQYIHYLQGVQEHFQKARYQKFFEEGKTLRENLMRQRKGFATDLAEVLLLLPDRPGILISALKPLTTLNINIMDIEVMKVREGESGSIRLGFKNQHDAEKAVKGLKNNGFEAKIR